MEGLIPVVYRSFKKNRIRRRYECLSSGAAQPYTIEDFQTRDDASRKQYLMPEEVERGVHHRRCSSVQVQGLRSFASEDDACYKPGQLVRFRSHKILSCLSLTGA